jgi:hypothetical protein
LLAGCEFKRLAPGKKRRVCSLKICTLSFSFSPSFASFFAKETPERNTDFTLWEPMAASLTVELYSTDAPIERIPVLLKSRYPLAPQK